MRLTFTKLILLLLGLYFSASSTLYAQSSGTTDAILQGFYWNTNPGDFASDEGVWWDTIAHVAPDLANGGIVTLWAPPANKGFAGTFDMGYGVYDYYDFGSFFQKGTLRTRHGNATQFFNTIDVLHQNGLKVMGDVVLNHRAGAEATQPEECDYQNDGVLEDRFTRFRPASGRVPMNAEDFHPTDTHCDLFGPYHDRVFFEDLCYFEDIDQILDPSAPNNGWYHGPHNLGRAGDSLVAWGRYLIDEVGFDELRLDAVKHIEPGFMAPFLVELAEGDQPFAVGELFDGNVGTLKGYRDEVEGFVSNFGTGTKDANLAIFDFNLRFAIRDFCNNTAGGYDMSNLNNAGLLFNGMPGEDIVTFVENHDFDRIGFSPVDCSDPDVVLQEGSTCLEYTTASGHDPVVFDKHMGYAYITTAEGRPSIFWKDWFWFGLKDEIKWQLAMRSEMASGSTTPIEFLSPFFNQGNGGDMFVMNRNGNSGQGGMVLTLNDSPNTEAIAFVNTPFSNMELKDYSDAYLFTQTAAFNDSRAQVKALPRNYAWYAPTGRYPTPPDAEPTAFTLGNHEGAKLHFLALRASDAANLLVNGAPIEPGDQIAVQPVGGGDAVGLGRIGQSFEWDGVHDMVIEVLGGGNASEAKGGLLNGDGFELVVFDKSTGTTEVAATLDFAANSTGFNFNPRRPASKGGAFSLSTTHSSATYQVGAISLITGFDTRPISCGASDAADSAYDDGWQSGDNDGSGFGAWTLSATSGNAGHFTASSTGNGDGDNNGDSDIDTGGRAWGLFANSGATSEAIRDFAQPLVVDETFSIQMDNGFVNGTVGFALQNSGGQNLLEFLFISGSANYTLIDDSGSVDSGVGYTDEGLDISLTLTGPATYELTVTRLINGASVTLSGGLINPAAGSQDISRLRLFNADAGFNAPANLYFNRLEICGEPACPIASVSAGTQTACDPADNTYDQEVTVNFNSIPADGQLSVNGTTVPLDIVGGAQTVNLTDLVSDGQDVEATVVLTGSEACTVTETALFNAPTDCQPPAISCPPNLTVNTDPGICFANVVYNSPVGSDNLPGTNTVRTAGLGSGANFPPGTTTETYVVTDAAGNMATCSFIITVEDQEPPVAECQDITVQLNANGQVSIVPEAIDGGSTDNCGLSDLSIDESNFGCDDIGNNPVTLIVEDESGNFSGCSATVRVTNTTSSGFTAQKSIIATSESFTDDGFLPYSGTSSVPVAIGEIVRFELRSKIPKGDINQLRFLDLLPAGLLPLLDEQFTIAYANVVAGDLTTTLFGGGLESAADAPLSLFDASGTPLFPGLVSYDAGINLLEVDLGDIQNLDIRCEDQEIIVAFNAFVSDEAFLQDGSTLSNSYTLERADDNDNMAIQSNSVALQVVEPEPEISKSINVSLSNPAGTATFEGGATVVYDIAIANNGNAPAFELQITDALNVGLSLDHVALVGSIAGSFVDNSTLGVNGTLDVSIDQLSTGESLTIRITTTLQPTVQDGEIIVNTANLGWSSLPGDTGATMNPTGSMVSSDAGREGTDSSQESISISFDFFAQKSITATSEAGTDNGSLPNEGNSAVPATVGEIVRFELSSGLPKGTVSQLQINDLLPAGLQIVFDEQFTLSFQNADQSNITVTPFNTLGAAATAPLSLFDNSGTPLYPGLVSFDAGTQMLNIDFGEIQNAETDSNKERVVISFNVVVENSPLTLDGTILSNSYTTESQDINGSTTVNATSNAVTIQVTEPELGVSKSINAALSFPAGSGPFQIGNLAVYDIVVSNTSSTPAYDVQVQDLLDSQLSLNDVSFIGSFTGTPTDQSTTGASGEVKASIDVLEEGETVIVRLTTEVIAEECQPFTLVTTAQIFWSSLPGEFGSANNPTGTSLLGVAGAGSGDVIGERNGNGIGPNDYTKEDEASIQLLDNTPPELDCSAFSPTAVRGAEPDFCGYEVSGTEFDPIIAGNCGDLNELRNDLNNQSSLAGAILPAGTTTVIWTATDMSGNMASCTFTATVEDSESPTAICQNVTVQLDENGNGSTTAQAVDNGSSDACGISSLSLSQTSFGCSEVGANTETLTVTDVNGNQSNCITIITVEDNIAPTAACLQTTVEIQPDGTYTLAASDVYDAANSSDNCAIASVSLPATTFDCMDVGMSLPVLVTLTDPSGNSGNCTANVSVTLGSAIPDGWSSNDIGQVTIGNAYSYDPCTATGGEFTITGSGNNAVSTTTDNVAFASQQLCGNGMITAKVESVTPNGYGGLMIRESSAAGAKQVAIFSNLTNVLRHERRTATNGPKTVQAFYRPFPIWLRLQRQGVWVFAYYSTTGSNFQYVHAVYAPMENCVEIGLASFTYLPNAQTETVFSNVSVDGSAALAGSGVPDFAQQETKQAGLQAELFPNPTSDAFILAFPEALTGEATATLRNQIGQVVAQRQLKPGDMTTEWDVRELPSGLYLLEVQWSNGFQTSFKVIRQ